jgi:hypothetical protein
MARFEIERRSSLAPVQAWRRLTTWERHSGSVPLTRMTVRTPPPTAVGSVIVGRTGLGPAGFDDPMRVTLWEPPYRCHLEKIGRTVTGWARIEVVPRGAAASDGCLVRWTEDLRVRGVPRALDPLTAVAARLVFGRALRALLAE